MSEIRLESAAQPLSDAWQRAPVAPRGSTLLGISFRPLQAAAFGLDPRDTLQALLAYPYQLIRLGAYWNQIEPDPGAFDTTALDWQVDAAEKAGKQIILCVGPLKTFGYPEFFVPRHQLEHPFPENTRIKPAAYAPLLRAATAHMTRLVERYRGRAGIIAWQLEHEAVDPLGLEHSWRLDASFVEQEAQALRSADPTRPLLMNGYLPATFPVRLSQWWSTRDQGDSLALARRLANLVGIDYYPRNALMAVGGKTLYLDGSQSRQLENRKKQLLASTTMFEQKFLVTEGQAEPWETVTTPPNPGNAAPYSCQPEDIIGNYNAWMGRSLYAYLFWGAEFWILRNQGKDSSYLQAFQRILDNAEGGNHKYSQPGRYDRWTLT